VKNTFGVSSSSSAALDLVATAGAGRFAALAAFFAYLISVQPNTQSTSLCLIFSRFLSSLALLTPSE
jgi:hypothetical protein